MVLKLAPLAAERHSAPKHATMGAVEATNHAIPNVCAHTRGDCSTVHLEAEANLEAHINANLDASGATVQPADAVERRDDRRSTGPGQRSVPGRRN